MPTLLIAYDNNTVEQKLEKYAAIGRSKRCTVCIKDIKLSRVQCEIIQDDSDFILVDLHSQNGTRLNGKLVTEAILKNGDKITIGRAELTFVNSGLAVSDNLPPLTIPVKKYSP
jgi:pSer/pThr/pTyr-binding forkhead associated (FHA) protein